MNEKIKNILKKYENGRNNKILNEILEKRFLSSFIVCNEARIIHTSYKYKKFIGEKITKEMIEIINRNNISGLKHYFEVSDKCKISGTLLYKTFSTNNKKGIIIVKCNKWKFNSENIEIISKLCNYIEI